MYSLYIVIEFTEQAETILINETAQKLISICPMNVFDIEDITVPSTLTTGSSHNNSNSNNKRVVVSRPRDCTMCRECIRNPPYTDLIKLRRAAQHYLFCVESSGCLSPEMIVREGIAILKAKAMKFKQLVDDYTANM
jgi:DNA-directed RNA polymerases I and III subunit RPAC1